MSKMCAEGMILACAQSEVAPLIVRIGDRVELRRGYCGVVHCWDEEGVVVCLDEVPVGLRKEVYCMPIWAVLARDGDIVRIIPNERRMP